MDKKLGLYLLKQFVNTGYDTYDSCVVVAESEDAARLIRPDDYRIPPGDPDYLWCSPEGVQVARVGDAADHLEAGEVVCSSFNAG